jgi:hypothetical protein
LAGKTMAGVWFRREKLAEVWFRREKQWQEFDFGGEKWREKMAGNLFWRENVLLFAMSTKKGDFFFSDSFRENTVKRWIPGNLWSL